MRSLKSLSAITYVGVACLMGCTQSPEQKVEASGKAEGSSVNDFLKAETAKLKELEKAEGLAWFDAATKGGDEAFALSAAAEDALNNFLADAKRFAELKKWREDSGSYDAITKRQLEVLYLAMLGKQVPPELLSKITALQKEVEQAFNKHRGVVDGKELTQNEVMTILREETDSKRLKAGWEAQKSVGAVVEKQLKELVLLRNQVAKSLGYRDFFALRLAQSEIDEKALLTLFDRLDELTREPFIKLKALVDERLAKRLGLKAAELKPWHYQNPFFQEPPAVFDTGLAKLFEKEDTLALCKGFYEGMGISVDDILARSDLYEKEGKSPHAFAADIDREGDVRVLANIVPGIEWQQTMIHELGHAVYDVGLDPKQPWILRKASHSLTTEGVAMMLDRLVTNPRWAAALGLISKKEAEAKWPEARLSMSFASLQFSRWTQVMLRFERELYANPEQDLSTLWWQLVEKYQNIKKPEGRVAPDYASKIHLVIVPVYYHNYMLGELFSAQLHEKISEVVGQEPDKMVYVGSKKAGEFLNKEVFKPGALYPWNELTRRVTGSELKPDAFARRFD